VPHLRGRLGTTRNYRVVPGSSSSSVDLYVRNSTIASIDERLTVMLWTVTATVKNNKTTSI
jgi:hypothetical protein